MAAKKKTTTKKKTNKRNKRGLNAVIRAVRSGEDIAESWLEEGKFPVCPISRYAYAEGLRPPKLTDDDCADDENWVKTIARFYGVQPRVLNALGELWDSYLYPYALDRAGALGSDNEDRTGSIATAAEDFIESFERIIGRETY